MELLAPRFSGLGYVFSILHDYRSIENLEDNVKEKAGRQLNGSVGRGEGSTDRTRMYDQGVGEPCGMRAQVKLCSSVNFDLIRRDLLITSRMMETALAKIRPHTSSSLPHQKTPATLLHALESTLTETHTDRTPTAYFAALITTLDGTLQKKNTALGDGDVIPAVLYLLALVAPFVPHPVIQSNLNTILSLTAPLFPSLSGHAPPLRSQLTLYDFIFRALDRPQLDTPAVRQSFATILQLCLDNRPKVRKRAIDLVDDVLSNPPSPLLRHPYAERVAEWMQNSLHQTSSGALPKSKSATKEFSADNAIRLLALLRPILPNLPLDVSTKFQCSN